MYSKMRAKRASQRSCYTHLTRPGPDQDQDRDSSDQEQDQATADRTRHITIHGPAKSRIILRNQTQPQQTADSNQTGSLEPRTGNVKRQRGWAKETAFRIGVMSYICSSNPLPLYI